MYPPKLIANNLRHIYLLKALRFYGLVYGGTNSRDAIYISTQAKDDDPDEFLAGIIHAELSSILFKNYSFPTEEWSKINGASWRYIGSGKDLLGRAGLYEQSEDLLSRGFMSVYSQASIEEDVNMYVSTLIERRSVVFSAAARHEKVRQKFKVLTKFYEGVKRQLCVAGEFEFLTRLQSLTAPQGGQIR